MLSDLDVLLAAASRESGVRQKRAAARLISLLENNPDRRLEILERLYPLTQGAYLLGLTGPPGAGKSTLTDKLAKLLLQKGYKVGIIAVDPSSPLSGGAILGDRIRMNDLTLEENIFIRSLGSRGALGGLSAAVFGATQVFDVCGCNYILIETVGVGQAECEIMQIADSTLVVSVPGLGDDIQMIKAGILEIGDIMVVNKADRPGAEQLAQMLHLKQQLNTSQHSDWLPPVVLTKAALPDAQAAESGIAELWQAICQHRTYLEKNGKLIERSQQRLFVNLQTLLRDALTTKIMTDCGLNNWLNESISSNVRPGQANPFTAVKYCLAELPQINL